MHQIIPCASRPLIVDELRHALAVERGDTSLIKTGIPDVAILVEVCNGLVFVEDGSGAVSLVLSTLQDIRGVKDTLFPDAERQICQTCLTYLLFDTFSNGPCEDKKFLDSRVQEYKPLDYASNYWGDHTRGASGQAYP